MTHAFLRGMLTVASRFCAFPIFLCCTYLPAHAQKAAPVPPASVVASGSMSKTPCHGVGSDSLPADVKRFQHAETFYVCLEFPDRKPQIIVRDFTGTGAPGMDLSANRRDNIWFLLMHSDSTRILRPEAEEARDYMSAPTWLSAFSPENPPPGYIKLSEVKESYVTWESEARRVWETVSNGSPGDNGIQWPPEYRETILKQTQQNAAFNQLVVRSLADWAAVVRRHVERETNWLKR